VISECVYLSISLSVHSLIAKITRPYFTKFSPLPVTVARSSSDGNVGCYTCTSGLWPEAQTTRMFHSVRQVEAPGRSLQSSTASCLLRNFSEQMRFLYYCVLPGSAETLHAWK